MQRTQPTIEEELSSLRGLQKRTICEFCKDFIIGEKRKIQGKRGRYVVDEGCFLYFQDKGYIKENNKYWTFPTLLTDKK